MNQKTGMIASLVTLVAVLGFAVSMIVGSNYLSYLSSLFISLGFVPMICTFASHNKNEVKEAGYAAIAFSAIYAVLIGLVYFAQMTTVQFATLNEQANSLLNYSKYGLLFNYDLLGYAFMALSTFFIGLTIERNSTANKWLKALLLIHGVFALTCMLMPMLGVFKADMVGGDLIGVLVLEFWCAYFTPVCILAIQYFKKQQ